MVTRSKRGDGTGTFEGQPCIKCGGTLRYNANRNCVVCLRATRNNKHSKRTRAIIRWGESW